MDDFRLGYVTGRFPQLQGLILMPLSLLAFATAGYEAGWYRLPGDAAPNIPGRWWMLALVLALAASYLIRAWYTAHFGVAPQPIGKSQIWPMSAGIAALPLGAAIQPVVPFSAPVALIALLLGAYGIRHYPFRRHYLAAAAVLLAFAFHRLLGVPAAAVGPLFDTAIGITLAIVGIGDHVLLVSTLQPAVKPAHAHV
jgi:hypothetical protein